MSFFDDKQEILKVELTTYGRFLVSRGKFKPSYYAFFDDDILYDGDYAQLSESQNSIQTRILDETLSIKPQTTFTSIENAVKLNTLLLSDIEKLKTEEEQRSPDKNYVLSTPLANSSVNSNYIPSWQLYMINGSILSSEQYIDNSEGNLDVLQPFIRYPQINLETNLYDIKLATGQPINLENYNIIFSRIGDNANNTYFYSMKDEPIILELLENNVDEFLKNFDVEIFMEEQEIIPNSIETKTIFNQLNFKKDLIQIENDILLDEPKSFEIEEDATYAEYYFEITVDEEIDLPPQQRIRISAPYDGPITNPPFGVDC